MAINAVTTPIKAYTILARPAPTLPDQVEHAAAAMAADESLHRAPLPGEERARPYVNSQGQTTGTLVNTTA